MKQRPPIYTDIPPWEIDEIKFGDPDKNIQIVISCWSPFIYNSQHLLDAINEIKKNHDERMKINEYMRRTK